MPDEEKSIASAWGWSPTWWKLRPGNVARSNCWSGSSQS